jgi:ABC-type nitrate/sulfonate/bicarbonate transport system permease component
MDATQNFDTAAVFAAILIIVAAGLVLMRAGRLLEARFARWRN